MTNSDKPKKKIMVKVTPDLELTKRYSDVKKKIEANTESKKGDIVDDKAQGITIEKKTQVASPKVFVRKVTTSPTTTTKIIGTDGTVVYEGRNQSKETAKALKENERHSVNTNAQRSTNANAYNVNVGSKKELTEEDKKSLISRRSADYQ